MPLAIASVGKLLDHNPQRAAKAASSHSRQDIPNLANPIHISQDLYFSGSALECRTSIIHVSFFSSPQSLPAAIFSAPMSLLPFLCLAVSFLGLSVGFALRSATALLTAVGLPPPATSADIKNLPTPAAPNLP
jgi:hypothetical protein